MSVADAGTSTRRFQNVTPAAFACVKAASAREHGTVYQPADADQGTATTSTIVGTVVLGFDFDPAAATLTYTIRKKPFIVSDGQIWDGISATLQGCG